MPTPRRSKLASVAVLAAGLTLLAASPDLALAGKKADAAKHTADLKAGDAKTKVYALGELGKLGQIQKSLVQDAAPLMEAALADKDATVRAAAAAAVGMIDPDPKVMVPKLLKLMKDDKDEAVRLAAIRGLGLMGTAADPAAKDLRQVMTDNDKKTKEYRAAKTALDSIKPKKK